MTRFKRVAVFGHRVWSIPHLAAFLPEADEVICTRWPDEKADATAGWARKRSARIARAWATRQAIPYLSLEEGFLRSIGLGQAGAPPLSLVADARGEYFDATRPSNLEELIACEGEVDIHLVAQAREAIVFKNKHRLSKYNHGSAINLGPRRSNRVLVIDQCAGDASIKGALADVSFFARMVEAAREENPAAEIIVKRHPAVTAGFERSCISLDSIRDLRIIDGECDLMILLEQVDKVYTVSSLAGFEALLLDIPVRCLGLPFYAGWGAMRDELSRPRFLRKRSVLELFAIAYIQYARYVNPYSGVPCTVIEAMEVLAEQKKRFQTR